jgi:hypothetical protein
VDKTFVRRKVVNLNIRRMKDSRAKGCRLRFAGHKVVGLKVSRMKGRGTQSL